MPSRASLDDFDFLIGRWIGQRSGDRVEEVWTRVAADALMGLFCWARPDGDRSYEFLLIEARATGVTLTVQAVPQLERAKPPQRYVARAANGQVTFDGRDETSPVRVIYRREPDDRLYVAYEREEQGRRRIYPWHYRAAPLAPEPVAT